MMEFFKEQMVTLKEKPAKLAEVWGIPMLRHVLVYTGVL